MELSDGIDFYEWNATVRSLTAAVERLERTAQWLMTDRELPRLIDVLAELNAHLGGLLASSLSDPCPSSAEAHPRFSIDQTYGEQVIEHSASPAEAAACDAHDADDGDSIPTAVPDCEGVDEEVEACDEEQSAEAYPPRFGDPVAIHLYGGRRRRR